MKEISLIVAVATNNGIGKDNKIPWDVPEELDNFRRITSNVSHANKRNAIIMGRNTWLSLPHKPLKNRANIVISNSLNDTNCIVKNSIYSALLYAYAEESIEKIFIIGGAGIYAEMLGRYAHFVDKIYLSIIYDKAYDCDKFIDMNKIYDQFDFDKENIHLTERYMFMIGNNKKLFDKTNLTAVEDEELD